MAGAVVVLMIVAVTGASLVQSMARQRFQSRAQLNGLQALWLAESGASRAAAKLQSGGYSGETWKIPASESGQPHDGVVIIKVTPPGNGETTRQVTVTASYPAKKLHRVTHRRTFQWRPE